MSELENIPQANHTWEALKVIGMNLPDLFRNYNHLLGLTDWSTEQEVFVIRTLQNSNMTKLSHPWIKCLEVLSTFEEAIKNGKPIPPDEAIELNTIYQEAIIEWEAELN
jgi:predicted methyltransferase